MAVRLLIRLLACGTVAVAGSGCVHQQFRCNASTSNPWLTQWEYRPDGIEIAHERILEIDPAALKDAIAALTTNGAIELSDQQLASFVGRNAAASVVPGFRPYLVRAVYPTTSALLSAAWYGKLLRVSAGGLGCAPFEKHPVIIYLEHAPDIVAVIASADL